MGCTQACRAPGQQGPPVHSFSFITRLATPRFNASCATAKTLWELEAPHCLCLVMKSCTPSNPGSQQPLAALSARLDWQGSVQRLISGPPLQGSSSQPWAGLLEVSLRVTFQSANHLFRHITVRQQDGVQGRVPGNGRIKGINSGTAAQ